MAEFDNGEIPLRFDSEVGPSAEEFVQRLAQAGQVEGQTDRVVYPGLSLDDRLDRSTIYIPGNILNFILKAAVGFALGCDTPDVDAAKAIIDTSAYVYRCMTDAGIMTRDEAIDQLTPVVRETGEKVDIEDFGGPSSLDEAA